MDFVLLDDDEFVDFNFSQSHDPALKPGHGPGFRSSSSVKEGDLGGSGGMERETAAGLQLTDKKGKIQ